MEEENSKKEVIENESDLTGARLMEMQRKSGAERVLFEYNGMWQINTLFNNMPRGWTVVQCMLFADAATFVPFNANMRSLVVDKLQPCELVVFNRMNDAIDKQELHKIVRGVSRRADIAYEYPDWRV